MSKKIPGISAIIKDYQIQADPITTPGDIVIILCDLPDELTVADPNNAGKFVTVPIPPNTPIIVNQPTEFKGLLSGENLKNGIQNISGKEEQLAIVNILPLLKTEKPVAVCKIVRRNGERPNTNDNLQLYEALENAYEQLGNYPAGSVIPAEISFEDIVINPKTETLSRTSLYERVLNNVSVFGKDITPKNIFIKQFVENGKLSFDLIEGEKTYKLQTNIDVKADNEITKKYQLILDKYKEAKKKEEQVILDSELLPLLEKATASKFVNKAKLETLKETYNLDSVTKLKINTDNHEYEIEVDPCNIPFNKLQENQVVDLYDISEELILANLKLSNETYAFSNVSTPVTDGELKITPREHRYNNQSYLLETKQLRQVTLDRSFCIVEKYDKESDTRTATENKINLTDSSNKFTSSALLVISDCVKEEESAYVVINDEQFEVNHEHLSESCQVQTSDITINYKGLIEIKLCQGLQLPYSENNIEYEITIIPQGASFDKRLVQFCHKLTTDLNECKAYLGSKPPKTINPKDIETRVKQLTNFAKQKNYADADLDKGLYLTVTFGSHKSGGYGGITNFPETIINNISSKNLTLNNDLIFNIGDKVDLITTKKGNFIIQETTVESVSRNESTQTVTVKDTIDTAIERSKTTKRIQITNKKDRKGSYLASMYATFANDYDIDKAPMNAILPGESEILFSRPQIKALLDANITPICRETNNLKGRIIDTPTLAKDESDFTDQGTVGIVFWLIRQLREICAPKIGKRFGSAAKQIVFQDELEAPFKSILGDKILDYKLLIDFAQLEIGNELKIKFSIKEAKKLKTVTIEARMF